MSSRSVVLFVKHSSVFSLALVLGVVFLAHTTIGQTKVEAQRAQAKSDSTSDSTTGNRTAGDDNDYSKKIKEYTTEPYFMTELVDHLPMSAKVPSPDRVLGYVVGTPNKLTYTKDLYRYYPELAKVHRASGFSVHLKNRRTGRSNCLLSSEMRVRWQSWIGTKRSPQNLLTRER